MIKLISEKQFVKISRAIDTHLEIYDSAITEEEADRHASFDTLLGWIITSVARNLDPDNKPAQKAYIDLVARHAKLGIDDDFGKDR